MLTEKDGENLTESSPVAEPEKEPLDPDSISRDKFMECGLAYSKTIDENWLLFLPRTMNSTIRVHDPIETGVYVEWVSDGPSLGELAEIQATLKMDVRDLANFTKSSGSIFFPSPSRLSVDVSRTKRIWFPKAHPRWLVAIFPFYRPEDDEHCVAELPPFTFPSDFTENIAFSRTP
jgi:hypothetical protein